jgi:hypothetical protein
VKLTVQATTAVIVKIQAAGVYAGPLQINQNGALEIFRTGTNGQVLHQRQIAAGGRSQGWSGWTELGGGISAQGPVAVVRNEDNTLEVFAQGAAGNVSHNRQLTPGGKWSGWSELGKDRISGLEAATGADGSVSVFGIGANGDVWTDSQSAPGVGWSGWQELRGKPVQPGFAVGQDGNGRLEIFGVDREGAVWQNGQAEGGLWSGWTRLGGKVSPRLGVARNLDGRLEVFGLGAGGRILHNPQRTPGGSFGSWSELGGASIEPGFVVGQYKDGRIAVFGVKARLAGGSSASGSSETDREARQIWSTSQQSSGGAWGEWKNTGAIAMEQFMVGNREDGSVQLFGVSKNSDAWSARESASAGGWTSWEKLPARELDSNPPFRPLP